MTKSKLIDGRNMFVVKTEHYVTLQAFCRALASHQLRKNELMLNLTKKEAWEILKSELFMHGIDGEYVDEDCDYTPFYNNGYQKAKEWVIKNYPYLAEIT